MQEGKQAYLESRLETAQPSDVSGRRLELAFEAEELLVHLSRLGLLSMQLSALLVQRFVLLLQIRQQK
jgi:hypothetical protein